jgi:hypothetical protein
MSDSDTINVHGREYVAVDSITPAQVAQKGGMPYVIVRCSEAGVHAGYLASRDDEHRIAELVAARRLWRWHGRTLSGLASEGTDDPKLCKFGDPIDLTVAGWCEIIPCSEKARRSLVGVARWVND